MQRTLLVFGLLSGLIVSSLMLLMMIVHRQHPDSFGWGEPVGYASMLLSASMIPVAIKSYRDRYQAGVITFRQAFGLGLGIALMASTLYVLTWILVYKWVYPDFVMQYTQFSLDRLRADGKTVAELNQARLDMARMFAYYDTWPGLIGITFLEIFPVGLLVALVSALVLKRQRPVTA